MMTLNIPIHPRKIARLLACIALVLAGLSIAGRIYLEETASDETSLAFNLVQLVNVNREGSLPAWFSALMLLSCSGTLALIAAAKHTAKARFARHWAGLAVIFLYLATDEAAAIHEKTTQPLQTILDASHHFYFAWIVVAIPLVLIFALVYLPFLLHLPRWIRSRVAIAGCLYVGGAILVEAISANRWYLDGGSTVVYSALGTIEELCEMWGAILFLYALLSYIKNFQVDMSLQPEPPKKTAKPVAPLLALHPVTARRMAAMVVFGGGINLILIQWVLVRELTALLVGTELVILLVSSAYFAGLSAGYWLSGIVRRSWLVPAGVLTLISHLTLPVWFRLLAAFFDAAAVPIFTVILLPLMTVFIIPAFYSVFLPLFVDNGAGKLPSLYALELLGSAVGIGLLVMLGGVGWQGIAILYAILLLVLLACLGIPRNLLVSLTAGAALLLILLPELNAWSNALWYRQIKALPHGTVSLYSAYSPYQKVDVLETPAGNRYLYLDSLEHFGSEATKMLDIILGAIPSDVLRPQNALVVGAGAMEMAAMIADNSGHVTTVEIDPFVVDASVRYFDAFNRMSVLPNRTVIIDDAKHFIMNTSQKFDLISSAPPAPFTIQTATLYSEPFFRAMKAQLNPGGIVAVNLTGDFMPDELVPRRVVASLLAVFDDVMVVTSGKAGWSFAYAGDGLPFGREIIEARLRHYGDSGFVIFPPSVVPIIAGDAAPITLDTMDIVLFTSADYFAGWLR